MSFGSVAIDQVPVVSNPKGGTFGMGLQPIAGLMGVIPDSYQQVIKDMGWFYSCKFDMIAEKVIANEMYDNGLARKIESYNHFGSKGWEGLITTIRQTTNTNERMVTLEKTTNKVKVRSSEKKNRYRTPDPVENIPMQNHYGILEIVEDLAEAIKAGNRADTIAELIKTDLSDPHRQKEFRDNGDPSLPDGIHRLTIFCQGYYWYLTRRLYNAQDRSNTNASTIVSAILTQAGQFVDTSSVATNTQQAHQQYDNDDIAWDMLVGLSQTGDTSDDRYIAGMKENRKFVYEKRVDATLENITLWKDENNRLMDISDRPVTGMLVRPNTFMRNTSIETRPGKVYGSVWDDPQVTYIGSVEYSEAGQRVRLQTEVPVPRSLEGVTMPEPDRRRKRRRRRKKHKDRQ